jgi:YrbI family 3-deoxy-D-manno-octulosonate 8-phosphate phosphatase
MRNEESSSKAVVAIIPARGGSKRIPNKNMLLLCGKPLISYSIEDALNSPSVDEVVVSTDNDEIAGVAEVYGAKVVRRPKEIADDCATSESALIHALDARRKSGLADPDILVFLQCTSPVRASDDIERAIREFQAKGVDTLFSACENNRLFWAVNSKGPYSLNYDFRTREREQEMDTQFNENGSIYVIDPKVLRKTGNRLGGRIGIYEMDYWRSFQIDELDHVELIEWILKARLGKGKGQLPRDIGLVVFDFDGVLTDNRVWVDENGVEAVACHRGDSLGLAMLREAGVPMIILSTEKSSVVRARAEKLQLECHQGVDDKRAYLSSYLEKGGIEARSVIFVGNDINDLTCMEMVGCAVGVGDSHPRILAMADIVLESKGGHGAVREVCEMIARAKKIT